MSVEHMEASTKPRRGWTKVRAILAGGLVLGVGAAITLAAWTDNEWARGIFASGQFGIEGSTNGTTWADHPTSGTPATLSFQVGADKLAPGSVVYAPFAVQLKTGSTNAANVTVAQDNASAIVGTTATYVYTTSATCNATTYAAGTNANGTSFSLAAVTTPTYLCFRVTAGPTLAPAATGSFTWTFNAESGAVL